MLNIELQKIVDYLLNQRGIDFSGYRLAMLERRTQKRLYATNCKDYNEYLSFLTTYPQELDALIDVFTINVSRFFRNPLTFEILRKEVFPSIIDQKKEESSHGIRVWSAGCAKGEEPYTIAIILKELLNREKMTFPIYIIGTDIDNKALTEAKQAVYSNERIENIKHSLVKKYFFKKENTFHLNTEVREMVQLSYFNLLSEKKKVPPDSIYGDFDIVFCRNVLIYLNADQQNIVFEKIYHSLKPNGYLVLGEAETPIIEFKHKFIRLGRHCKIFKKVPFL